MMKTKAFAFFTLAVLVLNLTGLTFADTRRSKSKKRQSNSLVALLPASDGVATFDTKRFFNDALPKVLSANQPMLGKIMLKVNEMSNTTGIDLRKFDRIAVGIAMKQVTAKNVDLDLVAVTRGDINAGALIAIAKLASNGAYREEKIGETTVYVFNAKDAIKKNAPQTANAAKHDIFDRAIDNLTKELAVASLDRNTLVIGSLDRVKQTLGRQTTIAPDITTLLSNKESSVFTFALRTPDGLAKLMPLESDELGKNIDSIRYLAGSMDVAGAGASVAVMARTQKPEQAKGLSDMLEGLQMFGKILSISKRADQKIYGRMVENARIAHSGNDVTLDLLVPQADIDVLVATIK